MNKHLAARKLQTSEVLDDLRDNGLMTVAEIAEKHEVSTATVRNRMREARSEGNRIIPIIGKNGGVRYRDNVVTEDEADETLRTNDWIARVIAGLALIGEAQLQLTKQARKLLANRMDKEERKILSKNLLRIKQIVDLMEIEE